MESSSSSLSPPGFSSSLSSAAAVCTISEKKCFVANRSNTPLPCSHSMISIGEGNFFTYIQHIIPLVSISMSNVFCGMQRCETHTHVKGTVDPPAATPLSILVR